MQETITIEVALALLAAAGVVYTWVRNNTGDSAEVLARLTRIETRLDGLADAVEKHNRVVERTFKLESDLKTAFKHIDLIRDDIDKLEDVKIGGTE